MGAHIINFLHQYSCTSVSISRHSSLSTFVSFIINTTDMEPAILIPLMMCNVLSRTALAQCNSQLLCNALSFAQHQHRLSQSAHSLPPYSIYLKYG